MAKLDDVRRINVWDAFPDGLEKKMRKDLEAARREEVCPLALSCASSNYGSFDDCRDYKACDGYNSGSNSIANSSYELHIEL